VVTLKLQILRQHLGFTYRSWSFPTGTGIDAHIQYLSGQAVYRITPISSLRELKDNIVDIQNPLNILNSIRPREFTWRQGDPDPITGEPWVIDPTTEKPWTQEAKDLMSLSRSYGFIVEEIAETQPRLLNYLPEDENQKLSKDQLGGIYDMSSWKPRMYKNQDLVALLVKAVQELSARVVELESR